ncbi:MAG: 50S ribosomal protein L3 [Patescibacteria group bacterium]
MKFILGTKEKMTQIFTDNGKAVVVTAVKAGPMTVIQVKTKDKDGYQAVQVGFGEKKETNINKAQKGHYKGLGNFRYVKEFRADDDVAAKEGDTIDASVFAEGDAVAVSGISKGKGFQGVVKRHGFHGGPRTHGQKHSEREAGSIGGGGRAGGRVAKGMRMPGRMGGDRITVRRLKVVGVDKENSLLLISGAVPGRRGTLLEIRGSKLKV